MGGGVVFLKVSPITTTIFKMSCSEKHLHLAVMDFLTFLRGAVDKLNIASSCIILAFETSLCGNNICRVIFIYLLRMMERS